MCIIAVKPEGYLLSEDEIRSCFMTNPDGAGFLVWDKENQKLICEKGFFTVKALLEAFAPYNCETRKAIVHFRIGTCGGRNKENCHPFLVSEDIGFVHNGMVNIKRPHLQYSDTWHLNEYLKAIHEESQDNWTVKRFRDVFERNEEYMGWSLFAFMDNKGHIEIINEKRGTWDNGRWFSNHGFQFMKNWGRSRWMPMAWHLEEEDEENDIRASNGHYPSLASVAGDDRYRRLDTECPKCKDMYCEQYKNWDMELEEFVCNTCKSDTTCDFAQVPNLSKTPVLDEAESTKEHAGPKYCEACGESPDGDLFLNGESRMWLCDQCAVAWHQMTQEERVNFLAS